MIARREKLLRNASLLGFESVAAMEPQNVFYLTGFWGEAIAISSGDSTKLIAPKLEVSRAEETAIDCEILPTERGSELISSFVSQLKSGGKTCTDCTDQNILDAIRRKLAGSIDVLEPNAEPFFQARKIKDQTEIKIISEASRVLDDLFELCTKKIKVGVSERALQALLVFEGMKMGANPPSYKSTLNPLIIGSGPNGALPHAEVSNRKFRKGDMIVVDLTLRYRGYIADATRTFVLGSASSKMQTVYEAVKDSQHAGLQSAKAGVSCGAVDSVCRNRIAEAGYAQEFTHSTGHGIGLDVHEPPWLRSGDDEVLQTGMTVTVEPGIYIKTKFGVRIEDSILVTDSGPKVLNKFSKDLISV